MNLFQSVGELIPASPSGELPWSALERLLAFPAFAAMRDTPQNPRFHAEGDVMAHTRKVCGALAARPDFHALPAARKTVLFLAALLHDVGKVRTTRLENGEWTSPHHSQAGERAARQFLWTEGGLSGMPEALRLREAVCALVRYHTLPVHAVDQRDPARRLRKVAAIGELAPEFSLDLLCMLSEADIDGRISEDSEDYRSRVQLCRMLADEAGCLSGPYPFPDGYTRRAYLSARNVPPDQPLFDPTWGKAVLVSGLPGTGKDTWIRENLPDLPMVSLDEIRRSMGIRADENQGRIIQAAQEQAREYLRRKQPFVWNATCLTAETREKVVGLAERYGAGVRAVYLETSWDVRAQRNQSRSAAVPESAVAAMLAKTVPPQPAEAESVAWLCV